ncbi:MAG TPA: dethiobiotin synthase [Gemmatimonadaceae bacterium]|nr:dethiobiotin synthase [Gemmatimonadaceae bacterium]
MIRLGVTGTDTGVGKTTVACALLAMLRARGVRTAAMKPVETGVRVDDEASDAARLRALANVPQPLGDIRPYAFPDPLAPLAAAERLGTAIDIAVLDAAFARTCQGADAVIVEGAGGALVPLTATATVLDLFHRWSLDVLIVAANRLGVLNHALLTDRAVRSRGLRLRAIVLVDAPEPDASSGSNAGMLARLTRAPVLCFPRLDVPEDARALADAGIRAGLSPLLTDLMPSLTTVR